MLLNLTIIYVEYITEKRSKYRDSFIKLYKYLEKIPLCKKHYIIVDNLNCDSEYNLIKLHDDIIRIAGDNSDGEFSGWQKGVEFLQDKKSNYFKTDIVLFANDAFLNPGPIFLEDYATLNLLLKSILTGSVIGRIDRHAKDNLSLLGYDVSEWVCTNCFFMPLNVLNGINNTIISLKEDDINMFVEQYEYDKRYFRDDAPVSKEYQDIIVEWLTCNWHSAFKPETNWELFRYKVKAIFNEVLLSAKIKEAGFKINSYGKKKYY